MKNKLFRDGDRAKIFVEGGWEIDGVIQEENDKKITIKDFSGDIVILFKKKICGVKIILGEKQNVQEHSFFIHAPPASEAALPQINNTDLKVDSNKMVFAVSKGKKVEQKVQGTESPYYFDSGLSIPLGITDGRPPGVTISVDDHFQMSMDQLNSLGPNSHDKKISFLVKEDE